MHTTAYTHSLGGRRTCEYIALIGYNFQVIRVCIEHIHIPGTISKLLVYLIKLILKKVSGTHAKLGPTVDMPLQSSLQEHNIIIIAYDGPYIVSI